MMMGYWAITAALMFTLRDQDPAEAINGIVSIVVAGGVAGWYLFMKENVARYYKILERHDEASEAVTHGAGS